MKMQKTIFLMCGPAGSGKSTWVRHWMTEGTNAKTAALISRDNIRFAMVKDDEEYFSKEDEVFDVFIENINIVLLDKITEEIYIDATHLTEKARNKVLDKLVWPQCGVKIIPVVVHPDLKTTLAQNEQREGRTFVPRSVIKRMDAQFQEPTFNEKHRYAEIWKIVKDGVLVIPNNGGNQ